METKGLGTKIQAGRKTIDEFCIENYLKIANLMVHETFMVTVRLDSIKWYT